MSRPKELDQEALPVTGGWREGRINYRGGEGVGETGEDVEKEGKYSRMEEARTRERKDREEDQ